MILLDTNVLVYATYAASPQHEASKRVVDASIVGQIPGVLVPQVLIEFVGVTTGQAVGTPLPAQEAMMQARIFGQQIRTLEPPSRAFDELEKIIRHAGRAGRRVFDYYLAAQARALGVGSICTYNVSDFADIPGVNVVMPPDVSIPK